MKGKAHACIGLLTYYNYSLVSGQALDIVPAALSVFFSLLPDLDSHHSILSKKLSHPLLENVFETLLMAAILFPTLYINKIKGQAHPLIFILTGLLLLSLFAGMLIKKSFLRKLSISFVILCSYLFLREQFHQEGFSFFMLFIGFLPWLSHRSFSHSLTAVILLYAILSQITPASIAFPCTLSFGSHILLGDLLTPSGVPLFFPFSRKRYHLIHTTLASKKIVPLLEGLLIFLLSLSAVYLKWILL